MVKIQTIKTRGSCFCWDWFIFSPSKSSSSWHIPVNAVKTSSAFFRGACQLKCALEHGPTGGWNKLLSNSTVRSALCHLSSHLLKAVVKASLSFTLMTPSYAALTSHAVVKAGTPSPLLWCSSWPQGTARSLLGLDLHGLLDLFGQPILVGNGSHKVVCSGHVEFSVGVAPLRVLW